MTSRERAEFWQADNGKWYFHRIAGNGVNSDPSQGYGLRRTCRQAIQRRWRGIRIVFLPNGPAR